MARLHGSLCSPLSQPFTLHPKGLPCPESHAFSPLCLFMVILSVKSSSLASLPTHILLLLLAQTSLPPRSLLQSQEEAISSPPHSPSTMPVVFPSSFPGVVGQVTLSQKAQYCLSQECRFGEFPGSPVVGTLCFYCSRPRSSPWSGN